LTYMRKISKSIFYIKRGDIDFFFFIPPRIDSYKSASCSIISQHQRNNHLQKYRTDAISVILIVNAKTSNLDCRIPFIRILLLYIQHIARVIVAFDKNSIVLQCRKSKRILYSSQKKGICHSNPIGKMSFCVYLNKLIQISIFDIFRETRKTRKDRKIIYGFKRIAILDNAISFY